MAQGKMKIKTKLPPSKTTKHGKSKKGPAVMQRRNAPIQPKKLKLIEANQIKKMVSKKLNEAMEDELREHALEGKKSLTKKKPPTAPKMHKSEKK